MVKTEPYYPCGHDFGENGLACSDCGVMLIDPAMNRGQQLAPIWKQRRWAAPDPTLEEGEHGVAWVWEILCEACAKAGKA